MLVSVEIPLLWHLFFYETLWTITNLRWFFQLHQLLIKVCLSIKWSPVDLIDSEKGREVQTIWERFLSVTWIDWHELNQEIKSYIKPYCSAIIMKMIKEYWRYLHQVNDIAKCNKWCARLPCIAHNVLTKLFMICIIWLVRLSTLFIYSSIHLSTDLLIPLFIGLFIHFFSSSKIFSG